MISISKFSKKVMQMIRKIPVGRVATYKQIAELAGKPQAARAVSWILHSCSTTYKLPWHRVMNSQGRISFEKKTYNYRQQKKMLEREGVHFSKDDQLNMSKYQWKKKPTQLKKGPKLFS